MKIELRKPKLSDAKEYWKIFNDKKVIKETTGFPYPCPLSRIEKELKNNLKDWKSGNGYAFIILADGEMAGSIILENPSKDNGRYDVGFFIGRKFWGKGIATEAIKQTVKFAFQKLNMYRIQGDNDSDNPASGRAMKKAGFKFEGVRKKYCRKKGKFVDLHLWGITK